MRNVWTVRSSEWEHSQSTFNPPQSFQTTANATNLERRPQGTVEGGGQSEDRPDDETRRSALHGAYMRSGWEVQAQNAARLRQQWLAESGDLDRQRQFERRRQEAQWQAEVMRREWEHEQELRRQSDREHLHYVMNELNWYTSTEADLSRTSIEIGRTATGNGVDGDEHEVIVVHPFQHYGREDENINIEMIFLEPMLVHDPMRTAALAIELSARDLERLHQGQEEQERRPE